MTPEEIDNMKNEIAFKDKEININKHLDNNAFYCNSNLSVNNNLRNKCDNNCDTLDSSLAYLENIFEEFCNSDDNNINLIGDRFNNESNIVNINQNSNNIDNNIKSSEINNNGRENIFSGEIVTITDDKITVNKDNVNKNIPMQDKSSETYGKCF